MSSSTKRTSQEERNKALIESFVEEIFNKHNLAAIDKYFGKDSIQNNLLLGKKGEGFKQFLTMFFTAFPNMHTNIEHIVAENNLVVAFLNGSGTQQGEFQGMPPTNKPVKIRSADLYRIEKGTIVEHWDVVDQLDLLKQTGTLLLEK
jgi:predicted ester cyclase